MLNYIEFLSFVIIKNSTVDPQHVHKTVFMNSFSSSSVILYLEIFNSFLTLPFLLKNHFHGSCLVHCFCEALLLFPV